MSSSSSSWFHKLPDVRSNCHLSFQSHLILINTHDMGYSRLGGTLFEKRVKIVKYFVDQIHLPYLDFELRDTPIAKN